MWTRRFVERVLGTSQFGAKCDFPENPICAVRMALKRLQTALPSRHECFSEFVFIGHGQKQNKTQKSNQLANGKIGCPALKHEHASCVTVIVQKHHPGWRGTQVPLAQLAPCVSVRADKPDVHHVSGASLNFSKRCCLLSAQLVAVRQPWRASLTRKVFRSV